MIHESCLTQTLLVSYIPYRTAPHIIQCTVLYSTTERFSGITAIIITRTVRYRPSTWTTLFVDLSVWCVLMSRELLYRKCFVLNMLEDNAHFECGFGKEK